MMKKWIITSVVILASFLGKTQTIIAGEYFFDQDPGPGLATPLSITPGAQVNLNTNIPVTGLAEGFHDLAIRFQEANGKWGLFTQRLIFIASSSGITDNIVAAEYLIDADPGVSTATPVSVPVVPGSQVNLMIDVPTIGLGSGFHTMAIRFQSANGLWGLYSQRVFYINSFAGTANNITAAEYFIDIDPGVGMGAAINIPAPVPVFNTPYSVPLPSGLSNGSHFLFMRVKDDLNRWSLFAFDTFFVDQNLPVTGMKLSGQLRETGHLLEWFTLTEVNTSHFEIEQSTNGVSFHQIGRVAAAGNSQVKKEYSFLFSKYAPGHNYYRLKQTDKDGRFVYSNMVVIRGKDIAKDLQLFPNPARKELRFNVGNLTGPFAISIINASGQIQKVFKADGNTIDISSLHAGTYILSITNGVDTRNNRFIKLE